MKRLALAVVLGAVSLSAYALSSTSDGRAWNRASVKEKNAFANEVVRRLGARYPASEMRACLDAFYVPPAPEQILSQEIGQIAALCHTQLQ